MLSYQNTGPEVVVFSSFPDCGIADLEAAYTVVNTFIINLKINTNNDMKPFYADVTDIFVLLLMLNKILLAQRSVIKWLLPLHCVLWIVILSSVYKGY